MKLLIFDLETTGTNPAIHGVHQLSGKVVIDGVVKETFDMKVQPKPGAVYDPVALQVGNVTEVQLRGYPSMPLVFRQFIGMLDKYVDKYDRTDKFFLVGYNNASFDNNMLRQWFTDNGHKYFGSYFWSGALDCMVLALARLAKERDRMENFKQSTVAAYLGVDVEEEKLHDASYDIELCHAIYDKVCGVY